MTDNLTSASSTDGHQVITVGDENGSYQVLVGRNVDAPLAEVLEGALNVLVIHQPTVAHIARRVSGQLADNGFQVTCEVVPDGESAKTVTTLERLWSLLGQKNFTRTDAVVTVGGGAATDLGGYVAASWLRGVRVVHISTSVAGMVDAAVGGKTGINTPEGKNLVGAFHPPSLVVCDLEHLASLPDNEFRPGLAEVAKCGFIADTDILGTMKQAPQAAADYSSDQFADLVRRSVQVKADVVSNDLKESGLREILNYGHTLGHAIENAEQYTWRHGNAVSVGLVFAAELSRLDGRLTDDDVIFHRDILQLCGLPVTYNGDFDTLLTAMRRDKKARAKTLRFVVLDNIGSPSRLNGPSEEMLREAYRAVQP